MPPPGGTGLSHAGPGPASPTPSRLPPPRGSPDRGLLCAQHLTGPSRLGSALGAPGSCCSHALCSSGWESQLLETGFLGIFLCPLWTLSALPRGTPTSWVVVWGFRWLIFRIMLGAVSTTFTR